MEGFARFAALCVPADITSLFTALSVISMYKVRRDSYYYAGSVTVVIVLGPTTVYIYTLVKVDFKYDILCVY